VIPSPNIWNHPAVYEIENRAVDPDGVIERRMRQVRSWSGATVLDVGCGSGFHLPRFAVDAAAVIGVEPHGMLAAAAARRNAHLSKVEVRAGTAAALPVPAASVDVAHARWAYFFGPGCEPGLRELDRVVRRGGTAFVIDNDAERSTFGRWFRTSLPDYRPAEVDRFFSTHGWETSRRMIRWRFTRREDLAAVVRIEFPPDQAARILAEQQSLDVDYAVVIRFRHY